MARACCKCDFELRLGRGSWAIYAAFIRDSYERHSGYESSPPVNQIKVTSK
jgi:hypothetical protein